MKNEKHLTEEELKATWFQLSWAHEEEKSRIHAELQKLGRQTMNVRVMKDAKFIVLKTEEGVSIGWGGLDTEYQKSYPELFSLYLNPAYRSFSLGLLIESVRATYLLSKDIFKAYVRMTKDEASGDLMLKRLGSRFYALLDPATLDPDYVGLCHKCELFRNECPEQVYLEFDVERFVTESIAEIGAIDILGLPKRFRLLRNLGIEHKKVSGSKHAHSNIWRSHRPVWFNL